MIPNMRVLTVHSFGETPEEDFRVTLSAMNIKAVLSQDCTIQGRPVKITTILFIADPECMTLNLSDFDLNQIETCIGAYGYLEN